MVKLKKYYESKGYIYTKLRNEFEVKIEDLLPTSMFLVMVECDYCGKKKETPYKNYKANNMNIINKYACSDCEDKKIKEVNEILSSKNELDIECKGYYSFKENRINKLKNILEKFKDEKFDVLYRNKEFNRMRSLFNFYNENIYDKIEELGYSIEENFNQKPIGYYNNFKNVEKSINKFIDKYDRFPSQAELKNVLFISSKILKKHNGIYNIKRKMNYIDKNDLVDDNGFYNKSLYEYYVAQFLIGNNIKYSRENYPFPKEEGNYRCDFMFVKDNNEKIYCEVWGYDNRDGEKIDGEYTRVKNKKLELYEKYNLNLIEIDKDIFRYKNYKNINKNLNNIFKSLFNLELKNISIDKYIPASKMTNEELFNECIKLSDNKLFLPPPSILRENKKGGIYKEILKRFSVYNNFAKAFNVDTIRKIKYSIT